MANMWWPVKFTGIDPTIERKHIYLFFQPFGEIVKLFLREDRRSATIYFYNQESAAKAADAVQKPNKHYFHYEAPDTDFRRDSNQLSNSKTMQEFPGNVAYMYDIVGHKIPTLNGDDGEMYVAISDLQKSGFRLYPTKPNKLAYNMQIQEYVRMYLQIQMYKFACKYKHHINEEDKARIITNVADGVFDQIAQNSKRPTLRVDNSIENLNNDLRQVANTPLRRPKDMQSECPPSPPIINTVGNSNAVANDIAPRISPSVRQTSNIQQQTVSMEPLTTGGRAADINAKVMESKNNNHHQTISTDLENRYDESMSQHSDGSKVAEARNTNYNQSRTTGFDKHRSDDTTAQVSTRNTNYNQARTTGFDKYRNDDTTSQVSTGSDRKRFANSISVPLNTKLKVTVTYILEKNPKISFVQLVANQDKLEKMNNDVTAEAIKGSNVSPSEEIVCAVLFQSVWSRAIVRCLDPLRVHLLDYGKFQTLPENAVLRSLSNTLQTEPWLAVRTCKSCEVEVNLERNATYMAEATKIYDDGTHVFNFYSNVSNEEIAPKRQLSMSPHNRTPDFELMDLLPAGMNMAKPATSTAKPFTSLVTSKPPPKTVQHPTILDKLSKDMEVMVEFHFETYCKENSVVAFICIPNMNDEELDEVNKISSIAPPHRTPYKDISSIKIGDLVAVKSGEEDYFRSMVYKINKGVYSVANVDIGTVEDVTTDAIQELVVELKKVPFMSCICTYAELNELKEADLTFKVNAAKQLSQDGPMHRIQGMTVKPWNPLVTHGPKIKTVSQDNPVRPSEKSVAMAIASSVTHLRVGDIIRIIEIDLRACNFYCQTKDMYTYYNQEILENIPTAAKDVTPIVNPKEKQSVIIKVGTVYYRGIIDSISNQRISVRKVDVGGFAIVSPQDVFNMDSALANKKYSCTSIMLDGLREVEEKAIAFLNNCISRKEKFTITQINGNRVSMDYMGNNLLDRLIYITKPPGYWYKNLTYITIPCGINTLNFSYVNPENGDVYFTVNDPQLRSRFAELLTEISDYCKSPTPYHPAKGEICYAFCMEDWCRAHVISVDKEADEYFVFFIDFGNSETVTSEFIRCLPDESYGKIPPLCTRFIVQDLKAKYNDQLPPSIGKKIEDTLIMGHEYDIKVLNHLEDNTYVAKIAKITSLLESDSDDF